LGQQAKLVVPVSVKDIEQKQISPDKRYLLTNANFDDRFVLWDYRSSRQLKFWLADEGGFTSQENEVWLRLDDTLRILNVTSNAVIARIKVNQYVNPFFLHLSDRVLLSDWQNDSIFLLDYSKDKIINSWSVIHPEKLVLSKNDDFFVVQSNDSLYTYGLQKNYGSKDNSWSAKNLRGYELNKNNDFLIAFYTDTNAFEGLSDENSMAFAECIKLNAGVVQSYKVPGVSQFDSFDFNHDETQILMHTRWFGSYLFDVGSGELIHNFPGYLTPGSDSYGDYEAKYIDNKMKIAYWRGKEDTLEIWNVSPFEKENDFFIGDEDENASGLLKQYGFVSKSDSLILRGNSITASNKFLNETGSICLMGGGDDNVDLKDGLKFPYLLWSQVEGKVLSRFEIPNNDIISAFYLNNDTQLLLILENQSAMLWDINTGKQLNTFDLFTDNSFFRGTFGSELFKFRRNGEAEYTIEDSVFLIKSEYKTNGKNQLLVNYDIYKGTQTIIDQADNITTYSRSYNSNRSTFLLFDILSGELLQNFEKDDLDIGNATLSSDDRYVILETKQKHNDVQISLFKGEDWAEEKLYSKTETLKEFIQKEKLIPMIAENFDQIEYYDQGDILSFFETNRTSPDSFFLSNNLKSNGKLEIYSAEREEYIPSWIISEIDSKRNLIDFYLVAEGWPRKKQVHVGRFDLIDFLDKNYSNRMFNIVSDHLSEGPISDSKEIQEFAKRHGIKINQFEIEEGEKLMVFNRAVYKKNFTENLWNIENSSWEVKNPINYYLPMDSISPIYEYKQVNDRIKIKNLLNPQDSLDLYLFDNEPFLLLSSGHYFASQNSAKKLHYVTDDLKTISFDQLDIRYNRPDLVLKTLGNKDTVLIDSYRKAYEKRIRRLRVDTSLFSSDYSVPEADFVNREEITFEQKKNQLSLHIRGWDSAFLLDRFNVFVNEVPLFGERGFSLTKRKMHFYDTTVVIELSQGENRIETSFFNVNATESYRKPLYINCVSKHSEKELTYFIGIGIDKFNEPGHNLNYSVKDVRDLAKSLKEKLGSDLIIDTLFNENVSISNVEALKKRLMESNINDRVIISYSGHGLLNKEYDYFLSAYNVDFQQPEIGGIPYEVLEDLLDSIPARKKLLLIDACHSGEVDKDDFREMNLVAGAKGLAQPKGGDVGNTSVSTTVGLQNSFQLMQELFVNVQKGSGATIISAAAGDQFALEGGGQLENGFFTYAILEYMRTQDEVGINSLKKYVYEEVERLSGGLQKPTSRVENLELDWKLY